MITANGRSIEYIEQGIGPPVLFIPGSFSTPAAWAGIQASLPKNYRFISTSLCGYGLTDELRSSDNVGIENLVRVIEKVARRIGEPVHLVGHSFGGIVAFASALSGTIDVLSISTFEATPAAILEDRGHSRLYKEMKRISSAFAESYFSGEPDAARLVIDFWGGDGAFFSMPEEVQAYCRKTASTNILDWHTGFSFQAKISDYKSLTMPNLLVRGANSNAQVLKITDALGSSIPNCRSAVIDGAGHFLITSHSEACAHTLAEFLNGVSAKN